MQLLSRLKNRRLGLKLTSWQCSRLLSTGKAPSEAFAVIIGGGVAGTSVAYHLAKRGLREIVLLERGTLASSTTFHSPGLVSSSHPCHRYKPILAYSVELYSQLEQETGAKVNFRRPGTLRLATTTTRMDEFRRYTSKDYYKQGDVCRTTLIGPEQVKKLVPFMNIDHIEGALYTTGDGYLDTMDLTRALAKGAEKYGATMVEQCPSIKLNLRSDGFWDVGLEGAGTIKAMHVINAAGLWARDVGLLVGLDLPLVHLEHQYGNIGPIAELEKFPNDFPAIIDHESTFYVRKHDNSLLFGAFEKEKDVVIRQDWSLKGMPERPTLEPHFERVEEPYQKVCDLLPCLKGAPVDPKAVAFTMTPDCFPLVGPIEGVPRFWLQAGYFDGVTTAGGIGKYVADWIIDGEPPHELFDTDANRYARWADKKFLIARTKESYSMFYNWAYEDRPAGRPTGRVSGVYGSLVRDGAHMAFRTGWEVPASFSLGDEGYMRALMREYQMVTNKCGIVDLSWKGKIEVRGPEASALLSYVFSNEPPPIRHINTALMLTRSGRILAPLKVLHHDQNRSEFILLSDPEREIRDYGWIKSAAKEMNFKVEISPVSEYLASLALIGPNSRSVLAELTKTDVSDKGFPRGSTKLMRLANVPVIAAQSSATGELGYELFHNRADSLKLYQAIMREGAAYGIANFGLATLNALRMEQGFKLWGREITLDTNPYEVGLGNLVDLNKKDFIGKTSAIELSKKKYDRRQVLLQLDATASAERICDVRQVPQGMEVVRREGKEERIGQITSGCFSVKLQRPLCFAWISNDVKDSETLVVDLGNQRIPAQILDKPPAQPKVEGATSASI